MFGLFLSIAFDLLTFFVSTNNDDFSAGLEKGVHSFGSTMSVIAFFVRLVMAVVFWKDSLDFDNIMLGRKVDRAIRTINSSV